MGRAENLNHTPIVGNETGRFGNRRPAVLISTSRGSHGHPITGFLIGAAAVAAIIALFWPVLA